MVEGVWVAGLASALGVAALLWVANRYVKPALVALSFPLTILTFGLFLLVINAVLLVLVGWVAQYLSLVRFHVDGIISAFLGGLVISVVSIVAGQLIDTGKVASTLRRRI